MPTHQQVALFTDRIAHFTTIALMISAYASHTVEIAMYGVPITALLGGACSFLIKKKPELQKEICDFISKLTDDQKTEVASQLSLGTLTSRSVPTLISTAEPVSTPTSVDLEAVQSTGQSATAVAETPRLLEVKYDPTSNSFVVYKKN